MFEELEDLEGKLDLEESKLDVVHTLHVRSLESGTTDRMTMESLISTVPEAINPYVPVEAFTREPSDLNYELTLEGFKIGKAVLFASIGAILGALIAGVVSLYQTKSPADYKERIMDLFRKKKREDKDAPKAEDKENIRAANAAASRDVGFDWRQFKEELGATNLNDITKRGEVLLELIKPTGQVISSLAMYHGVFHNCLMDFTSRTGKLITVIDDMVSKPGEIDLDALTDTVRKLTADSKNDDFVKSMFTLKKVLDDADVSTDLNAILRDEIFGTETYMDTMYALTKSDWDRVTKFYPDKSKANTQRLELLSKYSKQLSGLTSKQDTLSRRRNKVNGSEGSVNSVDRDAKNAELQTIIRQAVDVLKFEMRAFQIHYNYSLMIGNFYLNLLTHQRSGQIKMDKVVRDENNKSVD